MTTKGLFFDRLLRTMAYPNFSFEKKLWRQDFLVLGVDEVGRGAWAGPVVAAAVAFPPFPVLRADSFADLRSLSKSRTGTIVSNYMTIVAKFDTFLRRLGIDDSKRLSSGRRGELAEVIREVALTWGVGEVGAGVIDRRGIVWATQRAMRLAVGAARRRLLERLGSGGWQIKPFLLVDAFHVKYVSGVGLRNQRAVVRGDQRSLSIAAASIIAKVYRDGLIEELSKKCPRWSLYGWERNKGYGTLKHRQAIKRYGLSRYHRRSFVKI